MSDDCFGFGGLFRCVNGAAGFFEFRFREDNRPFRSDLCRPSAGSLTGLLLLLFGLGRGEWQKFRAAPWYTYLGGLLGVAIVYLVVASISQIGVAAATTAIIVGQVTTAAVVNFFLAGLRSNRYLSVSAKV